MSEPFDTDNSFPARRNGTQTANSQQVVGADVTLEDMAAALLGKRAALFVPSGTMANQLAIRSQTQPGQEVIVESKSHIVRYEQGAAGALARY